MKNEKKMYVYFIISLFVALFLPLLSYVVNDQVMDVTLGVKTGPFDYLWKLAYRNNTHMQVIYIAAFVHYVGNAILIMLRRRDTVFKKVEFTTYNIMLLTFNLIMILSHIILSIKYFDMLAQDYPSYTAQATVVLMLIILLLIQNSKRGFIFGYKLKNTRALNVLYKIHGPIFLFALVYTLWYHPFVATLGHLFGFMYMYLLFIQISFTHTKIHYDTRWVGLLEAFVLIHGFAVAYFISETNLVAMFVFGFGVMITSTIIYSFSKNKAGNIAIFVLLLVIAIVYYQTVGISRINEIVRIPVIEYGGALVIYWLIILVQKLRKKNVKSISVSRV